LHKYNLIAKIYYMIKKMKIAIPTDDGVIIGPQFKGSRAFLVITMQDCQILKRELRWNFLSDMMTSEHGYFYNLCDCNTVIVSDIGKGHTELLESRKIRIVHTECSLISDVLKTFLKNTLAPVGIK
jgi:predicted Fe-Mo cluster-binding NifX family protein